MNSIEASRYLDLMEPGVQSKTAYAVIRRAAPDAPWETMICHWIEPQDAQEQIVRLKVGDAYPDKNSSPQYEYGIVKITQELITEDGERVDVHTWFGLSYSHYLVLPRSVMEAMPLDWQYKMTALLDQSREAIARIDPDFNDNYTVLLRGEEGRIIKDEYAEYRRPTSKLDPLYEAQESMK